MKTTTIKNFLQGSHLKTCEASREANVKYCTKEESRITGPYFVGEPTVKRQGARTDLYELYDAVRGGATMSDLLDNETTAVAAMRYPRGVQLLLDNQKQYQRTNVTVTVLWGVTGSGKTLSAWHDTRFGTPYKLNGGQGDRLWWPGYRGEKTLIIDDFYGWIQWHTLLTLLDNYPMSVEVKGGHVQCRAENIYITSNDHPSNWYHKLQTEGKVKYETLLRRLHNIVQLFNDTTPPLVEKGTMPTAWIPNPEALKKAEPEPEPTVVNMTDSLLADIEVVHNTPEHTPNASGWEGADIPPPPTGGWNWGEPNNVIQID